MSDAHALTWGESPSNDDKTWGLIAHISVYLAWFLGPVIVLLIYQEKSPFIKYHAIQALLCQVALSVVGGFLAIVVTLLSWVTCGVGALLFLPLSLLGLVPLYGAYKAYQGEWHGFPLLEKVGAPS